MPVLTKGNPSEVAITLDYRPDVLKGAVTGQITGVDVQTSPTAYAMAVLVDPATGASLGIDVQTVDEGLPVAFSVPYSLTDIQPTEDYVVTAEVGDEGTTWRNAAGVPVITNGNPKTAVQVVVTEVSTPTPSATPSPRPAPSAAPDPDPAGPVTEICWRSSSWSPWLGRSRPSSSHGVGGPPIPRRPAPGGPSAAGAAAVGRGAAGAAEAADAEAAADAGAAAATAAAAGDDAATPADAEPSADATAPAAAPPVDPPGPPPDATRPT